jgi:hypothetical protein
MGSFSHETPATFSAAFKKRDHNSRLVDGQTHTVRAIRPLDKVQSKKWQSAGPIAAMLTIGSAM